MFKPKLQQQEQGFTLVEVLVAILITVAFTAVALQVMVFAAVFKARARQYAEATMWIQEDLENSKAQTKTNNLPFETGTGASRRCGADPSSDENNGYAAALQLKLASLDNTKSVTIDGKTFIALNSTTDEPNPQPIGGTQFWLLRNDTNSPTPPYNILEIKYAVVRDDNGSPSNSSVANLYTEMIPDAALQCP